MSVYLNSTVSECLFQCLNDTVNLMSQAQSSPLGGYWTGGAVLATGIVGGVGSFYLLAKEKNKFKYVSAETEPAFKETQALTKERSDLPLLIEEGVEEIEVRPEQLNIQIQQPPTPQQNTLSKVAKCTLGILSATQMVCGIVVLAASDPMPLMPPWMSNRLLFCKWECNQPK